MSENDRLQLFRRIQSAVSVTRRFDFDREQDPPEGGQQPLPDAWFVDNLHEDGFDNPREALKMAIEGNDTGGSYLFSGLRGSGKTSELLRLQRDLNQTGDTLALYVDMTEYLALHLPVEIGDFLVTVLSALADASDHWMTRRPGTATQSRPIERFLNFWRRIELEGMDLEAGASSSQAAPAHAEVKATLKLRLKENEAFKAKLQETTRNRIDRVVAEAREFVADVVASLRAYSRHPRRRIVLIVDSVERLEGVGAQAKPVFDSVENLFDAHGHRLRFPGLHVVYTVPPWISAAAAGQGERVFTLPMVPVYDRPEPGVAHGAVRHEGVDRMLTVLSKRAPDWRSVIAETHMRRFAKDSGGDLREFFLLVRMCLGLPGLAQANVPLPAPEAAIEQVEKLRRNQFGAIPQDHLDWLARVVRDHGPGLPSREHLATLAGLLNGKLLLRYRNGDDWYDVHPLLWPRVERHLAAAT